MFRTLLSLLLKEKQSCLRFYNHNNYANPPLSQINPEQSEYLTFLYSDVIARSYETCSLMYEIVTFTLSFGSRISRLLQTYIPNIFKIVAFRPTTFAREIAMILPHLYHASVLKELFLAIVQMPVLSALMLTNFKVCETCSLQLVKVLQARKQVTEKSFKSKRLRPRVEEIGIGLSLIKVIPMTKPSNSSFIQTSSGTDWLLRLRANKIVPVDIVRLYSDLDLVHPRVVAASQLAAVLLKLFLAQVFR